MSPTRNKDVLEPALTIEEIIAKLKELQQDDDIEKAHLEADWIIWDIQK